MYLMYLKDTSYLFFDSKNIAPMMTMMMNDIFKHLWFERESIYT